MMRAVIAIVVVLVVVCGIVLLQPTPAPTPAQPGTLSTSGSVSNGALSDKGGKTEDAIVRPEWHVIDCGKPDYIEDKFINKEGVPVTVLEILNSTEGQAISYLHSPKWINKCIPEDVKKEEANYAGKIAGLAVYNFTVEREDDYFVFLSAKWTDTCGNSVWVLMNGPENGGHGPDAGKYEFIKDQNGFISEKDYKLAWHTINKEGRPMSFHLKKGANRIELHTRQDGPRFDQLVITTEANPPAVPRVKM